MPAGRERLLYVVTLAEVGGAQSYVRDLLPAALEHFDVTVAAHGDGPLRDAAAELDIPFVPLTQVRRPISPLHDTLGLVELTSLFRRLRPDIVHLNSSKAGVLGRFAAALARVPVTIFTVHGWAFKAANGRSAHLYLWADRICRPLGATIICVSETELRAGLAAGLCSKGRSVVIVNAVEPGEPPPVRISDGRPVEIVSVGRLAIPKDFSTLLAAFAESPRLEAGLTILGDGPLRATLTDEAERLDVADRVTFAGEVTDVRLRLEAADLFVLSSRSEGMPISVLEAMAAGLPVVASDVGGLHEVVVDGSTGYLVEPGNAGALAEKIALLADEPELRESMGSAGRARLVERFSLSRWRDAHLELYASLLAARRGLSA